MKISKREKILLGILVVWLILFGYFKYVYAGQKSKLEKLRTERITLQAKLDTVNAQINSIKNKESDVKVLNSKIQDKSKLLYPTIAQEKIIIELDSLMSKSKLKGTIGFSDIAVQAVEVKKPEEKKNAQSSLQPLADQYNSTFNKNSNNVNVAENKNNGTATAPKTDASGSTVEQMKVNLTFSGSYSNVIDFIKNIETNSKKIIIANINLSQVSKTDVSGSCELNFYAVPKVSNEDEEYMKWNYSNNYGKANPFDGGNSVSINTTIEQANAPKKEVYDFVLSARSINSDLPTIMLGKADDSSKSTYVYADSNGKEPIEIYFIQKDNKYYYKYKTSRGSYPMQYNGDGIEFKPKNNVIALKVFSDKRINADDKASADVKIINKTDKLVTAIVSDDDSSNPRVNILGEGSAVDVKRN